MREECLNFEALVALAELSNAHVRVCGMLTTRHDACGGLALPS